MTKEELSQVICNSIEEIKKLEDFNYISIYKMYMMAVTITLASIVEADANEIFGEIMAKINKIKDEKTLHI